MTEATVTYTVRVTHDPGYAASPTVAEIATAVWRTLGDRIVSVEALPVDEHVDTRRLSAVHQTLDRIGAPTHDDGIRLNANGRLEDWLAGRRTKGWTGHDSLRALRLIEDASRGSHADWYAQRMLARCNELAREALATVAVG